MPKTVSQFRASAAIAKASLLATFRSPTSVVFSILFPIIFIVVFGSIVDTNAVNINIGLAPRCDTGSLVFKALSHVQMIRVQSFSSPQEMQSALEKGRLAGILDIRADSKVLFIPHYQVQLTVSASAANRSPLLESAIKQVIAELNSKAFPKNYSIASLDTRLLPGREYRSIDFILPGQLGFSLLMAGVFGSAFLFFNLRQSLVLKRIFVTPIRKPYLILGEMLSRMLFQVFGFAIMVGLGYFAFHFHLINGFLTFLEMLLFSVFGLVIFMGIGFIISALIKNESSIAPVANTITLPQILLCGLFFPIESYPSWMQTFCNLLPLSIFVDGLRKIAFEGIHIWQMPLLLGGMICWSLIIGAITVKAFRWE